MSTLVLARKYRPRDFGALVGQEHVVQALANALTQQRLHHAYLFTGTRGVGKTTVSRILAKSLNCTGADGQGGITAQPCGVCDACREIDAGRFIDYVELDAASNRGVDEISQLLDQAVYKPVVGRFKVYMVDEVHMLSTHAFNAMLKTLEEPPEYLKFVLATTDPQKVPPTVLSRCLQFNLRPIPPQTVQAHLADVLAAEALAAEPGALRLISRAARGSMRDALSLADQAIAFGAGSLSEDGVRHMLGAVDRGHAERLVEALAAGDGAALIAGVDALRGLGLSAAGTLEEMAALLQQMAVLQAVPDAADATDPDTPAATRLAALLDADETQLLYSIVLHGRAELGLAPDEYSGLVMVLLRMLAFRPAEPSARRSAPAVARSAPSSVAPRSIAAQPVAPMGSDGSARAMDIGAPGVAPPSPGLAHAAPIAVASSTDSGGRDGVTAAERPQVAQRVGAPAVSAPASSAGRTAGGLAMDRATAPAAVARPAEAVSPARTRVDSPEPPPWLDIPDDEGFAGAFAPVAVRPAPSAASTPAAARAGPAADSTPGVVRAVPTSEAVSAATSPQHVEPALSAVARRDAAASMAARTSSTRDPLSAATRTPSADGPRPTGPAPLQPTETGSRWAEHVRRMIETNGIGAMVRELAMQAECVAIDEPATGDAVFRLRVERENLRAAPLVDKLATTLAALLGRGARIETEAGVVNDSPARRDAAERERRQQEAEQIIHDDPLVRSLMARYATARIVPGSVKPH